MKKIFLIILTFQSIFCLDNDIGETPPMGWNSWSKFRCDINEELIRNTIDQIVDRGLIDVGYKYIIIDDCWSNDRDENGIIKPDSEAFPNGIKSLVDYAHSKGLLFGLLSSAGSKTCRGRPGSYEHEELDALTFAEWGIDYLKFVSCNIKNNSPSEKRFLPMSDALLKAKRPIFYSINEWGYNQPSKWAKNVANSWRTTSDIMDNWVSMLQIIDKNNQFSEYAGPGGWNDPDMLQVGNGGMNYEEYKTHFSLWAISKAPLIFSCDISNMSDEAYKILSNEEVIAINQDPLGKQGKKIKTIQTIIKNEDFINEEKDVIIAPCDGSDRQKWDMRSDGSIRDLNGEVCLEIPECNRGAIQLQTSRCHIGDRSYCENSLNQRWFFEDDRSIKSKMDESKCINMYDLSSPIIQVKGCNKYGSKEWDYTEISHTIEIEGKCLTRASVTDSLEVWAVILSDNSYAVLLLNRGRKNAKMIARWSEIGLKGKYAIVRDLWDKKDLGIFTDFFETDVSPHSSYFLKISSTNPKSSNSSIIDLLNLAFISLIIIQVLAFFVIKFKSFKIVFKQYIGVNEYSETQQLKSSNNI